MSPIATTTRLDAAVPRFTVRDMVQTAEYYRDVLGYEIAGYWDGEREHLDASRPAFFGTVRRDQVRLHFNRANGSPVRTGRAECAYARRPGVRAARTRRARLQRVDPGVWRDHAARRLTSAWDYTAPRP